LAELVAEFARVGYRPVGLESLVTADEARARWTALDAYYRTHKHFLVTNGPYQLKEWSADAVTLEAFRDLSYPLGVGSYAALPIPPRAFITRIEPVAGDLKLSVEVETAMKSQRSYKTLRQPLAAAPTGVALSLIPVCRYLVLTADGKVALAGTGRL